MDHMLETHKAPTTNQVTESVDVTIGDQQVREIAYLAGLMDGEGSFSFSRSDTKGYTRLTARISMGITDEKIADYFRYLMVKYDLHCFISVRKYEEPFKPVYNFSIQRMQSVKQFVELVLPFLKGKKRQAEILLEFVNSRLDSSGNVAYKGSSRSSLGYPSFIFDLWEELRVLNGRHNTAKKLKNPESRRVKQLSNLNDLTSKNLVECKTLSIQDKVCASVKAEGAGGS
jgi:hypothetical protein